MTDSVFASFPYQTVETVFRRIHAVRPAQEIAYLGRFRYFQRMGFPAGRVGRGARVVYGMGEVWQLALAFELLQVGMPPVRAVRLIRTSWPALRRVVAEARGPVRDERRRFIMLFPRALEELAADPESANAPVPDPIGAMSARDIGEWLSSVDGRDLGRCLLVDPLRLDAVIERELGNVLGDAARVAEAMDEFSRRALSSD